MHAPARPAHNKWRPPFRTRTVVRTIGQRICPTWSLTSFTGSPPTRPRLSKGWVEGINARGVTDEQYVELLGVVVAAISIDGFHRALGLPLEPLPAPAAGEPSGYRPPGVADSGAWFPTVQPEDAGEQEADLYPGGRTGNVISAMSLVPDSVRMLLRLSAVQYLPMRSIGTPNDNADRAISRCQIELLAGRISALSNCFY